MSPAGTELPPALPPDAGRPAPTSPSDGLGIKLRPAPLEPNDVPLPINLATALRLSDARPLIVAAAQASAEAGAWTAVQRLPIDG